jgi:EamA domain-containing membrane protein RarD
MNRFLIILSLVFGVLGVVLTILPFGTLALIPIALAFIFALITVFRQREKLLPKLVLLIVFANFLTVIGKEVFIKDVVEVDEQFETIKQQSEQEAQKDLEGLE